MVRIYRFPVGEDGLMGPTKSIPRWYIPWGFHRNRMKLWSRSREFSIPFLHTSQ